MNILKTYVACKIVVFKYHRGWVSVKNDDNILRLRPYVGQADLHSGLT